MPVPAHTSADWIDRYAAGTRIAYGAGPAWQDVRLAVVALPAKADPFLMPAVTEPFIVWITSGEAEAEEREGDGPWLKTRLKPGSLYLTMGGAPYEFRFRTLTPERFEVVMLVLSLPLFNDALREVFGKGATQARVPDLSGFEDLALVGLLQQLKAEALRKTASGLFVRGIAQAIGVHLARRYAVLDKAKPGESPALPGYKLRRITKWMAEHLAEEFSLARLARLAGLSEFHFIRLFKRATGVPPLRYHIKLRIDAAQRLLRETNQSVIAVANQVGYSSPSHFAQAFRKETGLSPKDYRRDT